MTKTPIPINTADIVGEKLVTVGEQYSFYRVPKVLFTAECFKSLSCEAKGDCVGKPCGCQQELIQLGERVRQKRKDCHLSQETLARKVGISVNTVSRIEGGQAAISIEIFVKLVEVLGADANELLGKNPEGDRNPAHKIGFPCLESTAKGAENCNPDHKRPDGWD